MTRLSFLARALLLVDAVASTPAEHMHLTQHAFVWFIQATYVRGVRP